MADQIMPEGVRIFGAHKNAPDFVKGSIVISLNEFYAFCKAHPELLTEYDGKKQLKLQLLESKAGKLYAAADTYKPGEKKEPASGHPDSDLPF